MNQNGERQSIGTELKRLTERYPELRICGFDQIDSTNSEAKRRAADGDGGPLLLVARMQTAGRGRMGRSFSSPASSGIYFSLLYTPHSAMQDAVRITSATAVAVRRAIFACTGKKVGIKWVNDLHYQGKKVCGILCESTVSDGGQRIIVGIGINLDGSALPEELKETAGGLDERPDKADALVAASVGELLEMIRNPMEVSWLKEYREASVVLGKAVRWSRGEAMGEGIAADIDECGRLLVRGFDGKTVLLDSGEISLRLC